jgi:CO dehydrogenase maturation factor
MKLAIAGKGGVGKTSLTAWLGDFLSRSGKDVWLVDADTALSLGSALGLTEQEIPTPLVQNKELIEQRVGSGGFINMNPKVDDLPGRLGKQVGQMHLLVMGTIAGAGGGCGCAANTLLKALLAHLIMRTSQWLLVDLEAGVEHLGRGTISSVDGLLVVAEPSLRSLQTASQISSLARDLGLKQQALVLNRCPSGTSLQTDLELPSLVASIPPLPSLLQRQQSSSNVLDLEDREQIDALCGKILSPFNPGQD